MDKIKNIKTVKTFMSRVKKSLSPSHVVLFGSYGTDSFNEYSDIDVVVVSDMFRNVDPYERFSQLHAMVSDLSPEIQAFGVTTDEWENTHIPTLLDAKYKGTELL
jgi:predicted nucleotidyltransferase